MTESNEGHGQIGVEREGSGQASREMDGDKRAARERVIEAQYCEAWLKN